VPDEGRSYRRLGGGRYGLFYTSPCRDAAEFSAWMTDYRDLYGKPRIYGKGPDIGCTESQTDAATLMLMR